MWCCPFIHFISVSEHRWCPNTDGLPYIRMCVNTNKVTLFKQLKFCNCNGKSTWLFCCSGKSYVGVNMSALLHMYVCAKNIDASVHSIY